MSEQSEQSEQSERSEQSELTPPLEQFAIIIDITSGKLNVTYQTITNSFIQEHIDKNHQVSHTNALNQFKLSIQL